MTQPTHHEIYSCEVSKNATTNGCRKINTSQLEMYCGIFTPSRPPRPPRSPRSPLCKYKQTEREESLSGICCDEQRKRETSYFNARQVERKETNQTRTSSSSPNLRRHSFWILTNASTSTRPPSPVTSASFSLIQVPISASRTHAAPRSE